MMPDDAKWNQERSRILLDPQKINLNSGTLFPTPIPILEAVFELRRQMATNPSDFFWRQIQGYLVSSRAQLAEYLGCNHADLLLLPNVTFALNLVAESLRLQSGDEILTTDHEYGATIVMWKRIAQEHGLKVRQLQLPYLAEDPAEVVDAFARAIGADTRVLFFSHVTASTGQALPVAELCALARQRGLLSIVDGAHAPGAIGVSLAKIGADFYAANCHKWLMAPAGAGFLHVSPQRKSMLQPLVTSWGWGYAPEKREEDSGNGGSRWQWEMEFHGTADRCPQLVLPKCFGFRESLGGDDAIRKRCRSLSSYARQALAACGLAPATPENDQLNSGVLTAFDFPCDDVIKIRNRLWHEFDIECPVTFAAGKTFLRVSTAWFNTTEEIDRLAQAVRRIR
jgi:isopenicillin-N epimerase